MPYLLTFLAGFITGAIIYRVYYGRISTALRAERDQLRNKLKDLL